MRIVFATSEPTHILQPWERIVGSSHTTDLMAQWYIDGECPPAVSLAQLRRALPASLLSALVAPARPRKSDHDAWQWAPPEERHSRRQGRRTHAGRLRKRARG